MDTDGVDIEVLYCEVSAYRYLYLLADGRRRGDARVQRHAARLRVGRSEPADRHLPGADPRHRPRGRGDRAGRVDGRQVAAAPGVPRRARPARLLPRALRPHVGGDLGERAAGVLPHRPQHRAQPARRPRPDAAPRVDAVVHAAVGVRGARHVAAHRHLHPLPRAARSCSSSPGSAGSRATCRSSTTWCCARATSSRCSRASCRASTTTATWR